jgi:peptidoglycan/xylan/chitin deacetylase (PgdA/CDA1 family)
MTDAARDGTWVYSPTETILDKVRRKAARFTARRPARLAFERPTLSVSFDDAPVSATRAGAEILEAAGVRGTYFVSAGLAGRDSPMGVYAEIEDFKRLAAAGHEIGCHTYSHLDCGRACGDVIACDVTLNDATLNEHGFRTETFAYPYGEVSTTAKAMLGPRFRALRTVNAGIIAGEADLAWLPGVGIEGPGGEAKARKWMDRAKAKNAWVILYTHDVRDEPSAWGCTPDVLERLVNGALEDGFQVLPVNEALSLGLQTQHQ